MKHGHKSFNEDCSSGKQNRLATLLGGWLLALLLLNGNVQAATYYYIGGATNTSDNFLNIFTKANTWSTNSNGVGGVVTPTGTAHTYIFNGALGFTNVVVDFTSPNVGGTYSTFSGQIQVTGNTSVTFQDAQLTYNRTLSFGGSIAGNTNDLIVDAGSTFYLARRIGLSFTAPNSALINGTLKIGTNAGGATLTTVAHSPSVSNKALTSNVATLTTSAAHNFVVGQTVTITGVDATFNGTYTIASVPTTTTFTYAKTASDVASTAVSPVGTAQSTQLTINGKLEIVDNGRISFAANSTVFGGSAIIDFTGTVQNTVFTSTEFGSLFNNAANRPVNIYNSGGVRLLNFTSSLSAGKTINIKSGGVFQLHTDATTTYTFTNSGTFVVEAGGTFERDRSVFTNSGTYTLQPGGIIKYVFNSFGNNNATVGEEWPTTLPDGCKIINAMNNATYGVTWTGTRTISQNSTVEIVGISKWINGGLSYNSTGTTLIYSGTNARTVDATREWPASNGPVNVQINNSGGVTLSASRTVSGTLTLTNGLLTLGSNNLTVTVSISGGGNSSFVHTDGTGKLIRPVSASTTFPVGNGTDYMPVSFDSDAAQNFNVRVKTPSAGAPANTILSKVWEITTASGTPTLSPNFTWNATVNNSLANPVTGLFRYASGAWANQSLAPGTTGTYQAGYTGASCCGEFSPAVSCNSGESIANGNWSETATWCGGTAPNSGNVTIAHDVTLNSTVSVANLTINSSKTLTLAANQQLTVTGTLTNDGTLTLENGATLLQTGSTPNAGGGTYNVKQGITGSGGATPNGRGWYMGSPVSGASSSVFNPSTNGNKVFHWNANQASPNWSQHTSGATMDVGKGYAVRIGETSSTITFSSTTLNNAPSSSAINIPCYKQTSTTYQGYNLVCNPFPSYLDWNDVWTNTNETNFESTIYYRVANGSNVMVFDTYNALNGQGTANTSGLGSNSSGSYATRYIPPMQAFWVKLGSSVAASSNAVNLTLDNSMRDHYTSVASGWTAGLKSTAQDFPMFLRLNIEQGSFKDQMLVFLKQQASSQYDAYDSEKMFLSGYPQVYTKVGTRKLVFNGLNSNKKITVIPVIVDIPTSGVFTFRADEFNVEDGLILLEDKQEGITQDLTINDIYTFYADAGTISNRFFIRFHQLDPSITAQGPSNSWVQDENEINEGGSIVVATNGRGKVTIQQDIDPLASEESHVVIRDAAGREVLRDKLSGLESIFQLDVPSGVYFVEVQLNGQVEVKKIFVQQ